MPILIRVGEGDVRNARDAMSLTQAAAHLGVNTRSFMNYVEEGEITPWPERLGNLYLFIADDVEALKQKKIRERQKRY